jgi:hypothetical protein
MKGWRSEAFSYIKIGGPRPVSGKVVTVDQQRDETDEMRVKNLLKI